MSFNENTRVPLKEVSQVPSFSLVSEVSHGNSKSGCDRSSSSSSLLRVEIQNQQPQPPQPLLQSSRKQRRSWSSELHRRFVDALQQLGGAHGRLFVFSFILSLLIVLCAHVYVVFLIYSVVGFFLVSILFWIWE